MAFSNGFKWFYYEVNLEEIVGKHAFKNYNSLIYFAASKIISVLENDNSNEIYDEYKIREINSLSNNSLLEDLNVSREGNELLMWENGNNDYNEIIKNAESDEINDRKFRKNKKNNNFWVFALTFILISVIGVIFVLNLANKYWNS